MLTVVTGSRGWGIEGPTSDWDIRRVKVSPLREMLSPFGQPKRMVEAKVLDKDMATYELQHFVHLLAKHNHQAMEVAYTEPKVASDQGRILQENAWRFLNSQDMTDSIVRFTKGLCKNHKDNTPQKYGKALMTSITSVGMGIRILQEPKTFRITPDTFPWLPQVIEGLRDGDDDAIHRAETETLPRLWAALDETEMAIPPFTQDKEWITRYVVDTYLGFGSFSPVHREA